MLKFEININENEYGLSSPTILVTEVESDESLPIILPEQIKNGKELAEQVVGILKKKFVTVEEVRKAIYG